MRRCEGKNVDEELVMRVDEEIHVVQVNRQPSVYQQGVVDMTYSGGQVSEYVREVILSAAESEVD